MYSDEERVADWLRDVIDNSDWIAEYLGGSDFAEFLADRMMRDAIERCLARITEAAIRLGPERIEAIAPELPFHKVRSLGNFLRHSYDAVDPTLIWDTVQVDVPALRAACEQALSRS